MNKITKSIIIGIAIVSCVGMATKLSASADTLSIVGNKASVSQTGWLNANGTWYFLNSNGTMAKNTTIDGYVLNSSGAWIQNTTNNSGNAANNTSKTTNEYFSNTPQSLKNVVSISPKHVYYQNGNLVMEAYVYNGFNHNVWNLTNANIKISTAEKVIASAHFNSLDGVQIGGNNYVVWTFNFPKDCVYDQNANLNDLIWDATVKNKY